MIRVKVGNCRNIVFWNQDNEPSQQIYEIWYQSDNILGFTYVWFTWDSIEFSNLAYLGLRLQPAFDDCYPIYIEMKVVLT